MTTELPVDVVVPAWGGYLAGLAEAVESAAGATVIAVVEPSGIEPARRTGAVVVTRPPGGVGPARQAGLTAASRPYVLFLDADDRLRPGALAALVRRLERAPDRVVGVTGALRRTSDGSSWPNAAWARAACLPGCGPLLLWRNVLPSVGACLMRRSALPPGELFPDLEDEDWHAVVRLRAWGAIRFRPDQLVDYSDRAGTLSRRPRDVRALARSRAALVRAASGSPTAQWWRVVERLVCSSRARADRDLVHRWGSSSGGDEVSGARGR